MQRSGEFSMQCHEYYGISRMDSFVNIQYCKYVLFSKSEIQLLEESLYVGLLFEAWRMTESQPIDGGDKPSCVQM